MICFKMLLCLSSKMIDVVITFFANVIISDKLKLWRSGRYMSHYLETGTLCIVKCNIFFEITASIFNGIQCRLHYKAIQNM